MTRRLIQELSFEDFMNSYETINPLKTSERLKKEVSQILEEVKLSEDEALINFSKKFDNVEFSSAQNFKYEKNDFKNAYEKLDSKIIKNLEYLKSRITKFHSKKTVTGWKSEDSAFNEYGQIVRPINRVGLYAPGGTATYPSSVLMTSVLANIAGVNEIEAKRQVYGIVGIDSLTGPSEVMIIADDSANPEYIAADLLAQAEHGEDSSCFLVLIGKEIKKNITDALQKQLSNLKRSAIAKKSLENFSFLVEVEKFDEAELICNFVHPEHLQISLENSEQLVKENLSAGAIFIGSSNSAVFGDYCAGPSHVIPTNGASRFSSQVNLSDFFVTSSYSILTENHDSDELQKVIDSSIDIAEMEGLFAHSEALKYRKKNIKSN